MTSYPTSCVEALTPATYSPKVNKNTIFSWFLVVCGRLVHGHPNLFSYLGLTVHPTFSLHVYRFLWWQDSTFKILARETRGRIRWVTGFSLVCWSILPSVSWLCPYTIKEINYYNKAKTKDQQTNENGEREREKAGAPMITY